MNRVEIENFNMRRSEDLCKLVEEVGYNEEPRQLQCRNGAHVSSLLHFFDDNPGAMVAVVNWIADNHAEEYDEEEEDECEDEEDMVDTDMPESVTRLRGVG